MTVKVNRCNGCPDCVGCGRNHTEYVELCDRCQDAPVEIDYEGLELCLECAAELRELEEV